MERITSKYWSLVWLLEQSLEKEEKQLPNYKKIQELGSKCPNLMITIQVYWKRLLLRNLGTMLPMYNFVRFIGTTERVCLITGSLEAIMPVMDFIMDKIREKPDLTLKTTVDFESRKTTVERDKQVQIFFCIQI